MISVRAVFLAAALLLPLQAQAAGFREQQGWQFRSPSSTQVLLNLEVRRLDLRQAGGNGGGTAVTLGGAAFTGATAPNRVQSGGSALNAIDATPTVTVEGSNNVVTIDGFLNLNVDQQADRARSRILNR